MRTINLFRHWAASHLALGVRPRFREFNRVIKAYRTGRFYHTDVHLLATLDFVDEYDGIPSQDAATAKLALFYHDIVYTVGSKTNEEDSAADWLAYAQRSGMAHKLGHKWATDVVLYILATKTHKASDLGSIAELVLDADMSIFIGGVRDYYEYAMNVAREFLTLYTPDQYVDGRIKFLESIVPSEIYYTEEAKICWESARTNIEYEIAQLSNGALLRDVKTIYG